MAASLGNLVRTLGAAASALLAAAPAWADEFDKHHKELLQRKDLQFEFAKDKAIEPRPQESSWLADFFRALSPIFEMVFWVALALGVAALLWFIGREAWASRFGSDPKVKEKTATQETDYRPEPAKAKALLEEADRLAALGKFDEAARTLLHRSIEDIEQRIPQSIRKAQTSREIAGLPLLPAGVRAAFAPITQAVERSWFGGRPLDAPGYQVCRKAYSDFALAESWSGARA